MESAVNKIEMKDWNDGFLFEAGSDKLYVPKNIIVSIKFSGEVKAERILECTKVVADIDKTHGGNILKEIRETKLEDFEVDDCPKDLAEVNRQLGIIHRPE